MTLKLSPSFSMTKNLKSDSNSFFSQRSPSGVKSASSHQCQGLPYSQQVCFFFFLSVSELPKTKQEVSVQAQQRHQNSACCATHSQLHRLLCDCSQPMGQQQDILEGGKCKEDTWAELRVANLRVSPTCDTCLANTAISSEQEYLEAKSSTTSS